MVKKLIKYAILTVCGVVLFITLNHSANLERTTPSIGGEAFFLIMPLMWWIIERTAKDFIREYKRLFREIKSENGNQSQEYKQTTTEVTRND
ncbi:MAG: hypothetical protein NC452_17515 [Eubacterium sp.]|nr:hypothetical protein [Eubacterium sp.]